MDLFSFIFIYAFCSLSIILKSLRCLSVQARGDPRVGVREGARGGPRECPRGSPERGVRGGSNEMIREVVGL